MHLVDNRYAHKPCKQSITKESNNSEDDYIKISRPFTDLAAPLIISVVHYNCSVLFICDSGLGLFDRIKFFVFKRTIR